MNQELVEKQRSDEQWKKYNESTDKNGLNRPTERQIAYIVSLAKTVGLKVNIERIDSTTKASTVIDRLKMLSRQRSGYSAVYASRDRRVAFGMATKLVFKKYLDSRKDYRKLKGFWKEVEELYKQYQKNQERVLQGHAS